ncbi:MAG: BTAD domain-containing putative transcriptional regulator [Fodinibius sp.]|nr:BTAD domain-containing putative transcriptional regulator [Fodinibius sp.]
MEREQLDQKYHSVLKKQAQKAEKCNNMGAAIEWWSQLNRKNPYNTYAVRQLMEALLVQDRKPEALRIAQKHAKYLQSEVGANAQKEYQKLIRNLENSVHLKVKNPSQADSKRLNPRAIAVLPFSNLNGEQDINSFAVGIHNDLMVKLSSLSALKVISRNSVEQYQDSSRNIFDIGQRLGVGTIIEGSVQNTSEKVRVHVQLSEAQSNQLLWAETYQRNLTAENIFDIQSELAEKISETLQATLTRSEKKRVHEVPTKNLQAYHFYVQGRTHLNQRTKSSIRQSLKYFNQAIDYDEKYALAWAGLAEALALCKFYGYTYSSITTSRALEAGRKTLDLDPNLAEGRASMGIIHAIKQDAPAAVEQLELAVQLQPSYAEALNWLAWVLMMKGDIELAMLPAEQAKELDPISTYVRTYMAEIYLADGRFEEALGEARIARRIQPEFALTHFMEGIALFHLEHFYEAMLALRESMQLVDTSSVPSISEAKAIQGLIHVFTDEMKQAQEILLALKDGTDWFSIALLEAALGNHEAAINKIEMIEEWSYFNTVYLRYLFPDILDPIRQSPKYPAILKKVNQSWNIN